MDIFVRTQILRFGRTQCFREGITQSFINAPLTLSCPAADGSAHTMGGRSPPLPSTLPPHRNHPTTAESSHNHQDVCLNMNM